MYPWQRRDSGTPDICLELYDNGENEKGSTTNEEKGDRLLLGKYRTNQDPLQAPIYLSRNDLFSLVGIMKGDLYVTGDEQNSFIEDSSLAKLTNSDLGENSIATPASTSTIKEADDTDQSFVDLAIDSFQQEGDTEQKLRRRLQQILSSVKEARIYNEPASSLVHFDSEEDDFNLPLPSNLYASPKFERRERLDVKKPGPWFSVNNFAFGSEEEDSDELATDIWSSSKENSPVEGEDIAELIVEDIAENRKNSYRSLGSKTEDEKLMAVQRLLKKMNDEQDDQDIFSQDNIQNQSENAAKLNSSKV